METEITDTSQGGFLDVLSGNKPVEVKHTIGISPMLLLLAAVIGFITILKLNK